jgi:hypothetical protein
MPNHIGYAKNLFWVHPFVAAAAPLVPLHLLTSITGYKTKGKGQDYTQGWTLREGHKYRISIATHVKSNKHHIERSVGSILEVLSHELAHLSEWEHTAEHWILELRISKRFARLSKKLGITDLTDTSDMLEFL